MVGEDDDASSETHHSAHIATYHHPPRCVTSARVHVVQGHQESHPLSPCAGGGSNWRERACICHTRAGIVWVFLGGVYVCVGDVGDVVRHHLQYPGWLSSHGDRCHHHIIPIQAPTLPLSHTPQMAYVIDAANVHLPEALEILADSVLNPEFHPWEVQRATSKLEADLKTLKDNPQSTLLEVCVCVCFEMGLFTCVTCYACEYGVHVRITQLHPQNAHTLSTQALHSCAYTGALGRPLICPSDHVALLNADVLKDFVSTNYTAPRLVLAGSGMDHSTLVNLATPLFEGVGGGAVHEPVSTYVGGDWRCVCVWGGISIGGNSTVY